MREGGILDCVLKWIYNKFTIEGLHVQATTLMIQW